jgi:hypothetical protein
MPPLRLEPETKLIGSGELDSLEIVQPGPI